MICCQSLAARRFLLWYILIISLVVLPLSWDVLMGCNMILVGPLEESRQNLKGFGFFSNAVYDDGTGAFLGCVDYSQYLSEKVKDNGFTIARIFAALLGTFIILATFLCLLVQCFNKHGKTCLWAVMTWSYVAAFMCQGGVFIIMMTDLCVEYEEKDSQCLLGRNGIISIANGLLLFGMVIATLNSSPPRNPVFRCWYATSATSNNCDTDNSEPDVDVENPTKEVLKRSSSKTRSSDDNESVSLFGSNRSKKSWLSLGPKLTVKEHARRLEEKNIWPMNQMRTGAPLPKVESRSRSGPGEPMVDPRVQTYYRTQRNVFKRFESNKSPDTLKKIDTMQTASAESESSGTIESVKGKDFITKSGSHASTTPQSVTVAKSKSYSTNTISKENEDSNKPSLAQVYLRQLQMHQAKHARSATEEEPDEVMSVKSGSANGGGIPKSGSSKSSSSKSGGRENSRSTKKGGSGTSDDVNRGGSTVKTGTVNSGGSADSGSLTRNSGARASSENMKSTGSASSDSVKNDSVNGGSIKNGSAKSGGAKSGKANDDSVKSKGTHESSSIDTGSSASTFLIQQLAETVVLGNGGVRKEKSTIGKTMKIVDEYPAPAESRSRRKDKYSGSPIVKVRTEYCPEGRKTVLDEVRPDGSRVVTTLIDPLTIDEQLGL